MEDEKQDVTAESSTAQETQTTESVETQQSVSDSQTKDAQDISSVQTTNSTPSQLGEIEAVDEFGVPYKNRAAEWKRKSEEIAERLPEIIRTEITSAMQNSKQQQKQYTIEELEMFAANNPDYRAWVEAEKEKIRQNNIKLAVTEALSQQNKQKELEFRKQQTFNYVASNYPEIFAKDQNGRLLGIDLKNPVAKEVTNLMQDPRLAQDPDGLRYAIEIAYGRYSRQISNTAQKQTTQLKAEVKDLQKKTLIEGSGKQTPQSSTPLRTAIDKLKQTGSKRDAQEAVKQYFRRMNEK